MRKTTARRTPVRRRHLGNPCIKKGVYELAWNCGAHPTCRLEAFQNGIRGPAIDIKVVRNLAFKGILGMNHCFLDSSSLGIPDVPGLRAVYWKILLGLLPLDRNAWSEELVKRRATYAQFKRELIVDPHEAPKEDDHVFLLVLYSPLCLFVLTFFVFVFLFVCSLCRWIGPVNGTRSLPISN